MKKKSLIWIGLIVVIAALAACSSGAAETETGPDMPPEELDQSEATEAPVEESTEAPAEEMTEAPAGDDGAAVSGGTTYTIVSEETEARFHIQEILMGQDTEVIGVTNDVSGSITVDLADPQSVSMSTITIGVDSLATDNPNRNRSMHGGILESGTYPTATFTATGFSGVPAAVAVGDSFDFQITGDLTIHGTTQNVTFDATATVASETRLEGTAELEVLYQDYGIQILRLPQQVASVEDNVILEIAFVAES